MALFHGMPETALRQLCGEALSDILADERGEALSAFGERLHRFDFLFSGFRVVVAVSLSARKFYVDVVVANLEGDYAGGSA